MFTAFIIWYACGVVAVGMKCKHSSSITLCQLFWFIVFGGLSFLAEVIEYLQDNKPQCPIVWRKNH